VPGPREAGQVRFLNKVVIASLAGASEGSVSSYDKVGFPDTEMTYDYELIDFVDTIEHGMVTYKGLPAPLITDHLSREQSREFYAPGTEFTSEDRNGS